ncbi:ESCRT-II complex subunit VPS36 [Angomonas deanei]|nr:ESCRT-II complex subunit VPS36 [Angomonas deanei]|eukprot:EPY27502.1 ESCRT-II complex subunit VPS36 [Angomonas deanei]
MTGTFKDIDDVMQQASSLVQNIKQLKQKSSGNSTQEANEFAQLESIEETLGLGVMVKARGGGKSKLGTMQSKYHVELANELHAWMTHPKNGKLFQTMPIIPLIELFSIYNKARSGDLVSPEDVLLACREMTGMPSSVYTLETLSSGRMALVHKDTSIVLHRLTKLLGPRLVNAKSPHKATVKPTQTVPTTSQFPTNSSLRSVNEIQLANEINVSSSVAKDLLEQLEDTGYLCRSDAGFGCASFYWNIFVL